MRILWAADGLNGKGNNANHRTTPTTLNWKEIDTYVVKANGVWLWVPERRVLSFVHEKDCRKDFCLLQPDGQASTRYIWSTSMTKPRRRD